MNRKLKILIITYLPWRGDNSIGNSYSNIFHGCEDKYEFAQIYIRDGMPQNNIVHKYYHISEMKLLKRLVGKREPVGKAFDIEDSRNMPKDTFSSTYNKARILRWEIFFMIRELIGLSRSWKTEDFDAFLDSFKPDIVFGTLSTVPMINRIMWYVKDRYNIPLITYPWDDYYSLKHVSFSPFFWIRKFYGRHYLRKTALRSNYMYVITDLMKREYENAFHQDCRLLYKGYVFDNNDFTSTLPHDPIQILYMGNIGLGRWQTLRMLAQAIKQINDEMGKAVFYLNVYTLSPQNKKIKAALNVDGCSQVNPPVANEIVEPTMRGADILVHAEPCKLSQIQFFRASFSTKLVDYFHNAKCILAIGGMTASTDYLASHDAAIVVKKNESIYETLKRIFDNNNIITIYAQKAWDCGYQNHQIKHIQARVYNDFLNEIEKNKL